MAAFALNLFAIPDEKAETDRYEHGDPGPGQPHSDP